MAAREDMEDRALGAIMGAALGDALGMPTQLLSPGEIGDAYGEVRDFVPPKDDHPVSRRLAAGTITDDTEQMLLLAEELLAGETFDQRRWVEALVAWEADVIARGSHDLLGPSTKRAIAAIRAGEPAEEAGRSGDTNGAAMRVAPVGLMMPLHPLEKLVEKAAESCRATHNTSIAIASAAAVAAAVSCGIEGRDWRAATSSAIEAASLGAAHGHWTAGASIAARIAWAVDLVSGRSRAEAVGLVTELVGTSLACQESVPAAFAVVAIADGDAWEAGVLAANLGGDTDTVGAIAGAVAGACTGFARLPREKVGALRGIDVGAARQLASRLVAARLERASGKAPKTGKDAA